MLFWLTYLHLALAHSEGQGHCYAYFDHDYFINGDRCMTVVIERKKLYALFGTFTRLVKGWGKGQGHAHFDYGYLVNSDGLDKCYYYRQILIYALSIIVFIVNLGLFQMSMSRSHTLRLLIQIRQTRQCYYYHQIRTTVNKLIAI